MIIAYNMKDYDFEIITNTKDIYSVKFEFDTPKEEEFMVQFLRFVTYPRDSSNIISIYIKIAEKLNILNRVKLILLLTKYNSLI